MFIFLRQFAHPTDGVDVCILADFTCKSWTELAESAHKLGESDPNLKEYYSRCIYKNVYTLVTKVHILFTENSAFPGLGIHPGSQCRHQLSLFHTALHSTAGVCQFGPDHRRSRSSGGACFWK